MIFKHKSNHKNYDQVFVHATRLVASIFKAIQRKIISIICWLPIDSSDYISYSISLLVPGTATENVWTDVLSIDDTVLFSFLNLVTFR